MSIELTAEKALIFRILHRDNFADVLENGCLSRTARQGGKYTEIGNQELISKRNTREVPCGPGGTLSDYVPFYFTPFSPMLYNILTGYSGITKRPASEIVILVSSLHRLKDNGVEFVFSDRHAYLKTALFSDDLDDLEKRIIWDVLQARNFRRDDLVRFEKYQAEALAHNQVPLNALMGAVCYNSDVKAELEVECLKHNAQLKVFKKPGWYP